MQVKENHQNIRKNRIEDIVQSMFEIGRSFIVKDKENDL